MLADVGSSFPPMPITVPSTDDVWIKPTISPAVMFVAGPMISAQHMANNKKTRGMPRTAGLVVGHIWTDIYAPRLGV